MGSQCPVNRSKEQPQHDHAAAVGVVHSAHHRRLPRVRDREARPGTRRRRGKRRWRARRACDWHARQTDGARVGSARAAHARRKMLTPPRRQAVLRRGPPRVPPLQNLVLFGVVWFCLVLCGFVWCCVVLFCVVWFCLVLCGFDVIRMDPPGKGA